MAQEQPPQQQPSAPPPSYTQSTPQPNNTSSQREYYARPPSPTPSNTTTTSTILPSYEDTGSYKGFPSEAAYLSALKSWAESKQFVEPSQEVSMLSGFYGKKTLEEYKQDSDKEGKSEKKDGKGRFWKKMARREEEGS